MAGKGKCRTCGADILWMKTARGKNMPVDFDEEIEQEVEFDGDRMTSHFETCPDADKNRKQPNREPYSSTGPRLARHTEDSPVEHLLNDADVRWED